VKKTLELRGISAGYNTGGRNRVVVRNVDLSVSEGELLVLAGPNGSGKTTLIKIAGGLLTPLEGKVKIDGKEPGRMKPKARAAYTAFLFQVRDSPWPFTVRETVAQGRFFRRGWFGAENREDREAVNAALEKAGLLPLAERPLTELSGGELQRVYIARCMAQEAAFLLLDEPENNLDPKYSFLIFSLLHDLVKEGRGAIVSLHDLRLASLFADRIALLSLDGSICALGTPEEVLTEEKLSRVYGLNPELVRGLVL